MVKIFKAFIRKDSFPKVAALFLRFVKEILLDFRGAESLDAFISGFRLADGIHRELDPPYSYEAESEAQA